MANKTKTQNEDFSEIQNLSHLNEDANGLGQIKINHSVIASIVRLAALEVEGVYAVGGRFVDGIAEIFSKRESDRGVRVVEDEHGQYVIDIRVVLVFGYELAKVAVDIQENVSQKVRQMTMKDINRVNVTIDGVKMCEDNKSEQEDWDHHHVATD